MDDNKPIGIDMEFAEFMLREGIVKNEGGIYIEDEMDDIADELAMAIAEWSEYKRVSAKLHIISNCGCSPREEPLCDGCQAIADTLNIKDSGIITEKERKNGRATMDNVGKRDNRLAARVGRSELNYQTADKRQ